MKIDSWKPIAELAAEVQSGEVSALSLVEKSLGLIEKNKSYKTVIATLEEPARARAKKIDEQIKQGEKAGRLAGVPFIAKDNFLVFGAETTAASNILKGFEPPYQATAINRLEAEGAICVAKANLDAFAHGSSTENSDFFTTLNPYDTGRVPGGSSGGSAAAVALGLAPFALGTDTGGSIRQPASFCGVVGYKPTYGLVSRSGVVAMASSTDVIGPLARTVADAALVLDCMAGRDTLDMTTIKKDEESYGDLKNIDLSGLKVGVVKEFFTKGLDKNVEQTIRAAIDKIKKAGAKVDEISLKSSPLALACYYIICPAEISSNLSRYDGQRYGYSFRTAPTCRHTKRGAPPSLKAHRGVESSVTPSSYHSYDSVRSSVSPSAASLCESCKANLDQLTLDQDYELSRDIGFGDEAKRRIMIGTYVLSSGYYDAYYKKAQQVRTELIAEMENAFSDHDVLVGPTSPTTAFKMGENTDDPLKMYMSDVLTVSSNLTGNPSISIPAGKSSGLPVGLQIIGRQRGDKDLLSAAKALEKEISNV